MTFCCQGMAAQCRRCLVPLPRALHLLQGHETCVSWHPTDIWADLVFSLYRHLGTFLNVIVLPVWCWGAEGLRDWRKAGSH